MVDLDTLAFVPSYQLLAEPNTMPERAGVYLIFFDARSQLLERSGYLEFDAKRPVTVGGFDLLYVGATGDSVRRRVLAHLDGNSRTSSLRMTLGALLSTELNLDPVSTARTYFEFGDGEQRLSDWLCANTRIAFLTCTDPFAIEKRLLRRLGVPLNITHRKHHPYSKYLMTLRAYFAGRPKGTNCVLRATTRTNPDSTSTVGAMC